MNEEFTKTTTSQRIIIGVIALFLILSTVGVYAASVLGNSGEDKMSTEERLAAYERELDEVASELTELENKMSTEYYEKFSGYRSRVKAYNANTANNSGVTTEDLVVGTGEEIGTDYSAYYIGWCANEEVFDSSFDDYTKPTRISPITHSSDSSFVTGWEEGVKGMKFGGVREISMPGELAYGEDREICGGTNSPLRFLILAVKTDESYTDLVKKYNDTYEKYYMLYIEDMSKKNSANSNASGDE